MPTGIYESLSLKNEAYKESLDKEIQKIGKEAKFLYKASRDGFSSEVLW
jgi:hypothetical protein